jgi:hypothetical protein
MYDFIPVVSERMVLASMSDPSTYLGGDDWILIRPFTKNTWIVILIMSAIFLIVMKVFSFRLKFLAKKFNFYEKARNIVYLSTSFFFVLILAYYEGALIMFFSSGTTVVFDNIKDVMNLYPHRKLMMRKGYDIYYLNYVNSGDKDYIEFWDRVKSNPEETVYADVRDVFQRFPEGGVVIHELEGAIKVYMDACGGERKDHFDVFVKGNVEYHNLIVTKNSPLAPILNYGSRLLLQRGSAADFKRSWNINYTDCISLHHRPPPSMSMQLCHFAYLFLSLAVVFFVSILVFAGEVMWNKLVRIFPSLASKPSTIEDVRNMERGTEKGGYIRNPFFYSLQILDAFELKRYNGKSIGMGKMDRQLNNDCQVIIKTFTCEIFIIQTKPNDTILLLKSKIKEESGIPTDLQRLMFAGNTLENQRRICSYNICNNSIINCTIDMGKSYSF